MLSMLRMVRQLIRLGFYYVAEDLQQLVVALVDVLDGRTDTPNDDELKLAKKSEDTWYVQS